LKYYWRHVEEMYDAVYLNHISFRMIYNHFDMYNII